jgi:Domain of unknown function (DUF4287)
MSFQAYIDSIRAKTGKSPEDFLRLVGLLPVRLTPPLT